MGKLTWIEDPESKGLRLVGLAHEVSPASYAYLHNAVDHTGWFLDESQDETVSGVVYRLPGKNGAARYVVGVADPHNDGPALLDLSDVIEGGKRDSDWEADSALRDAARAADEHARIYAEREREYNRAWQAGNIWAEKLEQEKELRREALQLLSERRELIREGLALKFEHIVMSTKDRVEEILQTICEYRSERETLRDGDHETWYFAPREHLDTFNDAAGLA